MRKFLGAVSSLVLLLAGFGVSAGAVGAAEDYDSAKVKDFWSLAASAADYAVYAPTSKGVRRSGLQPEGEPPLSSFMQTICAGQWSIQKSLQGSGDNPNAGVYMIQAPSRQCMPDPRAGGAPLAKWSFKTSGKKFTAYYQGCLTTPDGQPEPAIADCPASQALYNVDGQLPAADGAKGPWVHIEADGMTRAQIRSLVRSMKPIS